MFHIFPKYFTSARYAFAIGLVVLALSISGTAQSTTTPTDGSTPLGLSPGAPSGSFSLSGFESVNPYNGNLNFSLPLIGVNGRGSVSTSAVLKIEAKSWQVQHHETINQYTGQPVESYVPTPNWWSPLVPGYGPGVLQGRQSGSNIFQCTRSTAGWMLTLTRLTFTAGDGTEYDLRDQQTGGQPLSVSDPCNSTPPTRGTVFISADGNAATFTSDAVISDRLSTNGHGVIYPSGYLTLRDGARYRIDGGLVTWMRDRNGNKLTFTYNPNGSGQVITITDSLNRQISITYADYSTTFSDQITYLGFGAASRTITVNYAVLASALRSGYTTKTYAQLFPELNGSTSTSCNPWVVSSVTLPNSQQYQFGYNSYGELARVVLPTGGAIEYDYTATSGVVTDGVDDQIYRRVKERRVYPDGTTLEGKTTFNDSYITGGVAVSVDQLNPSGTLLTRTKHYYYGSPENSLFAGGASYPAKKDGREYETEQYDSNGTTILRRSETTWVNRAAVSWWPSPGADGEPPNDLRVSDVTTTIEPGGANLVSKQTFGYDDSVPFNNQNNVKDYDFGSGTPGALVRETRTTFVTSSTYVNASLLSLPSQVSVYDSGGTERARTTSEYDNYATDTNHAGLWDRSGISGFDSAFTTSYAIRGNATASTHYLINSSGSVTGSIAGYAQYDIAGNVLKAIDARGYTTSLHYEDCFGTPNGEALTSSAPYELGSQTSFAFVTSATNAMSQTVFSQYDYHTGRPVDGQDANGTIASAYSSDALDRPTQIKRAVGTAAENQTSFSYDDIGRVITSTSDLNSNNDSGRVSKVLYDGLGRTIETRQYENGTNYIATQQQYDALGRAYRSSNPFRPLSPDNETPVWNTTAADALGRMLTVTTPDNAVVTTSYSGNTTTVTDQASKSRKSVTDGLGRLTSIYEDPATLNYQTSYAYDVLGDLTTVTQGVQTRSFVYDSLKRLTSATNPESGAATYDYDNNGNLLHKTDARSVTTTLAYDALNRPTSRSYNDSPQTPPVSYFYDAQSLPSGAPSFTRGASVGRLVAVTYGSGSSAGTYRGYDVVGRVVRQYQQTDSVNYLVEASYYANSSVQSETYPAVPGASDRRTVSYTNDSAGRLASLSSSATTYAPAASVANIGYTSHNALKTETYGNNLMHAVTYNNRLQPNEIKLGTSGAPTSVLDLTYSYGTTNNNGNLQSVSYAGGGLSYTQTFGYDELNRLTTSQEGASWSQTNTYDRYGNRSITGGGLSFTASNNRITGWSYDAAGNLLNDGVHVYTFDAENKVSKVDNVSAYVYDGEGQRVRKLVNENLRFISDIGGQQIAEFDGSSGALKKEYVYGASGLVTTIEPTAVNANGTRYTTSDHLGSPRVVTNSSGAVASRHDFMPYGEELYNGGRTVGMGYGAADGLRQKFTSKERDIETGLDYFGARYYSSTQGRYTSVDPIVVTPERFFDPQQFNLYSYTRNNPLRFIDPTGEKIVIAGEVDQIKKQLADILGTEDAAKRITFDSKTGTITVDLKGIDLSKNEGASLLSDAIGSEKTYGLTVGTSVETLGGQLSLIPGKGHNDTTANLDNNPDDRYSKGKTDMDKPPKGKDDQIGINYDYRNKNSSSTTKLPQAPNFTVTFHELAEAYAKVEHNKQYAQAHQEAIDRETRLRDQRPYLKGYNPGSGPGTNIIIRK